MRLNIDYKIIRWNSLKMNKNMVVMNKLILHKTIKEIWYKYNHIQELFKMKGNKTCLSKKLIKKLKIY